MEEAEILCDEIIILDKGKIIAQGDCDTLKSLAKIEEKITVETNEIKEKHIKELMGKRSVFELTYNNNLLTIKYNKGKNNLEELISYLKENKIKYNRIFSERPTLNDVFLELTGKELRD